MEITSKEVYAKLLKEVGDSAFKSSYQELRKGHPQFAPYQTPTELLTTLSQSNIQFEEKDCCLYALICAARRKNNLSAAALSLLLVTMWPTLILVTQRFRHLLTGASDPLAEVYWAFLEELENPTYDRQWKIAANLFRNTAKRTVKSLRSEWQYQKFLKGIQDLENPSIEDPLELARRFFGSPLELSDGEKQALKQLTQALAVKGVINAEEAFLVIGHAIYGASLKDLAKNQRTQYPAVRQRYSRLKTKLRAYFELDNEDVTFS